MPVETAISVEEYLRTSYSPDKEYRDGVLVERNVGTKSHAWWQTMLGRYAANRRRQWDIEVFTELRIRARQGWYPIPDLCIYQNPVPEEQVPTRMPLLWIEILSPDDTMVRVLDKARQVVECGSPYVWIIDPDTLESYLRTATGLDLVPDKTLRLPDSPVVIPLLEVMDE